MVHKPEHKVHSFRGLLGDGGLDEINLERQNVNLAYRIVKFAIIPNNPGGETTETVVMIQKESFTPSTTVDFTNQNILGAAFYGLKGDAAGQAYTSVIFDNILFSRNIFVGSKDSQGFSMNYYIEIEEVPVTAATLMQLKLAVARKLNLSQDPLVT